MRAKEGEPRRFQAWSWVLTIDGFIRLHQLFFTGMWLLLGAASVGRDLNLHELGFLMAIVLCFHVFTYVLNDVIDLPIDRTQPQRQNDPLVRGAIRPWQALVIALIQPAIACWLTMMSGGGAAAVAVLAAGMTLMGVYNLWGKRCVFPPVTDAIQGCAWASLAIFAPLALGEPLNPLASTTAAYVVVFTLLFNGVHGSLRDLRNDLTTGSRTTAIYLGARPTADEGNAHVPAMMAAYASAILVVLIGITATLLLRNDFAYSTAAWTVTTVAVGAEVLFAVLLHPIVVRPRGAAWDTAWRLQLYLLMMIPASAFAAHVGTAILLILMALNAVALLLFGCTARVARWAWAALPGAAPRAGERLVPSLPRAD